MPDEQLKVGITGDASGLEKASQAAVTSLNKIDKEAIQAANALQQIPKVSDQVSAAANNMARSAANAGGAIEKSKKNYTGLTRVLQDLPFGFIAISNNLEQLIPAAGGAGLAFSGIISILSFAQVGLSNWTRGLGGSKEALDEQVKAAHEARQALDTYVESLNDINKARITGLQDAQKDLVNLQTLYAATQNANIPLAERKKLVDELQEQYPKYFANIKDEIILAGGAKDAYDRLSAAIIASAKARAAQDVLVDIQKQILAVQQQYTDAVVQTAKLQQELNSKLKGQNNILVGSTDEMGNMVGSVKESDVVQGQLNSKLQTQKDLLKQIGDLQARAKQLAGTIQQNVQQNPEALLDPTGNLPKKEKNDELKKILEERRKIIEEFSKDFQTIGVPHLPDLPDALVPINKSTNEKLVQFFRDQLRDALLKATHFLPDVSKEISVDASKLPKIQMPVDIQFKIDDAKKKEEEVKRLVQGFNQQMQGVVRGSLENLGENLGAALAGGSFDKVFKGIIASAGDFLQQLGKILIQIGIKMELFKKALYTWAAAHPALAIAAGVGLIAAGAFIKNTVLPKPKAFAEGGLVSGPTLGLIGEGMGTSRTNPEVVAPLDRLKNMLGDFSGSRIALPDGEWKIRGKDLVFVMNQTQKSQRRAFG